MKLKLIRTTWGILDSENQNPLSWDPLFLRLKNEGYEVNKIYIYKKR